MDIQRISPFLWFDRNAEEVATFYTSIFPDSRITNVSRYTEAGKEVHGMPEGMAMVVAFELSGQTFQALNGGPAHAGFNQAISFSIRCENQEEINHYWERLTADGGKPGPCGWLTDMFGLSWQVVPTALGSLMSGPDKAKAARVMTAMLQMTKIDIAGLEAAAHA